MLHNILNLKGVSELKKETKKSINGGMFGGECPTEGGYCPVNGQPYYGPPCMAGPTNLYCIHNRWTPCLECDLEQF